MRVHSALGLGLLESAYEACLQFELIKSGLRVEAQKPLPLVYESVKLECGYRVDLLVESKLIIEVKSIEALAEIHFAQVLTYLRLSNFRLALLLNFNVVHMKRRYQKDRKQTLVTLCAPLREPLRTFALKSESLREHIGA